MKKEYASLKELIKDNLSTEEYPETKRLIDKLKNVKKRGYFTKEEFLAMGMWKSPRPKQRYLSNSEEDVVSVSKKVFATKYEKRRIDLLTSLKGILVPAASAILMLTDPKDYGVIDIRVWQILHLYGSVNKRPKGLGLNFENWYNYLMKLRYYAKEFKVKARDIERTLFEYHQHIQEGNLYD